MQFICRLYGLFLKLFPRTYREEYSDELQAVFNLSLDDAHNIGGLELALTILREFSSLPGAILHEHLRERRRRKMDKTLASRFDFAPGSWTEAFAALAPFLLFGALPTLLSYFHIMDDAPLWLDIAWVVIFWGFGLGLLLFGFVKRFPRWFMPYIGVPMPILCLVLFNGLMEKWQGVWWYRLPWLLSAFIQTGLLWMGLIFIVILLLVATRFIPKSRPFHQRLMDDWTLLSFIIYGAIPLVLVFTYDEYKNEEPFMFLSLVSLAIGGWLYLRNDEPLKRFLYLYGGMALSMLVAAVGKALLVESSFPFVSDSDWKIEFMSTLVTWLWLALIILIAPALKLFQRPDKPMPVT